MSKKPKVFHLITRLLRGGAEDELITTIEHLDKYEFTVGFGADYNQSQVDYVNPRVSNIKQFHSIRHYNPIAAAASILPVSHYIESKGFDIVHTHSTEAGIIGRIAAALADVPIIVHTVHGVPFTSDRNRILNQFIIQCEKVAAAQTDQIVTNADAISSEYISKGIGRPEQYETIYSGIDVEQFQQAEAASDIDGSKTSILMVARLSDGKGHLDLMKSIHRADLGEVSVYLAGDGPLRDKINKIIQRLNLEDTVSLLGYREDIPSIMAASDIFVLPSYREGTPRSIYEAMAAGLPVISTDIAGIPEQVVDGETGLLVSPGDIQSLSKELEYLCSNDEARRRMGRRATSRAQKFSTENMVFDVDSLYQRLLK